MGPLDFTHTLVPERACGDCFACCDVSAIDDPALRKPPHVLCEHYRGGCTVYAARPATCRSFHCLWRRLAGLPDDARPDRIGVLFAFQREGSPDSPFAHVYVCGYPLVKGDVAVFDTPAVQTVVRRLTEDGGLPVWISLGERKRLVWPDRALGDAILSPASVTDPELKARAETWRKRYDRWVRLYDMAGGT
ncbi:MAG TPA: hypothetical protein VG407_05880 [Caulobacteraceae bacterium]|jgi:hypothetical protein|nr:hypothetical protein [Caulobacteraceae bacterium]